MNMNRYICAAGIGIGNAIEIPKKLHRRVCDNLGIDEKTGNPLPFRSPLPHFHRKSLSVPTSKIENVSIQPLPHLLIKIKKL